MTLLNTVNSIVLNTFYFNKDKLTEILLYGKGDLDIIDNTSILDTTINYLIEAKRFVAQLFRCSPDVMALTLILHLNSCFCSFFLFVSIIFIFLFFLGYFFYIVYIYIYIYIFALRCFTTYICIPGDCKFFCLVCRC